jgi:hypothetical protein
MDDLLAGTLFSLCMEFQCRLIVQRRCTSAACLWKTFRSKPNTIPVDEQKCSPSNRNGVRLQNGMLFGSQRNGVRLHSGIVFAFNRIPHLIRLTRLASR